MKLTRLYVLPVIVAFLGLLAVPMPALAATPDELTFSGAASNPNKGDSTFALNLQYLIGTNGNFLLGPTVTLFDAGETNGGLFGVTAKLRIGKTSGFWLGARAQKPSGDLADSVEYLGDILAGIDLGSEHAFATFYGSRTYSRDKAGATIDPDGTNFFAGIGWRL